MSNYRLTIFYAQDQNGFTEQFYRVSSQTNPKRALEEIGDSFFSTAIAILRTQGTLLQAARMSDVDSPRVFYLDPKNLTAPVPLVGAWDESPDMTGTSALVKLTANNGKSRRLWLRALSDTQTVRNRAGASVPPSVLTNRVNAYIAQIVGNFLSIRTQKPNTNPYQYVPITQFVPNQFNPNWTDITCTLPAQPALVTRVQFSGINQHQMPGLRGSVPFISNGNNVLVVPYAMAPGSIAKTMPAARVRWVGWDYPVITEGVFERFVQRKTGKIPFGVSRGRARPTIRRN